MKRYAALFVAGLLVAASAFADDDLAALNDEFDDPAGSTGWQRVFQTEGGVDQLQRSDVGRTRAGWLTLVPRAVTWYQDWRGPLAYRLVKGDFQVTTRLHVSNRQANGAPRSPYSLGGVMARAPRQITARTWRPGGENYLFLSLGSARSPGRFEWEVKTTVNSHSTLDVQPAESGDGEIRLVRVGPHFIYFRRHSGGAWQVHRRYHRADLPAELQVGLTVYSDWATAGRVPPEQHNFTALTGGNPDLIAQFDYVHFARPQVSDALAGKALSDPGAVGDTELLAAYAAD